MKQRFIQKTITSFVACIVTTVLTHPLAYAQLTNPVIGPNGVDDGGKASSGELFVNYFIRMWNTLSVIGALLVILYFVWGAIDWITSAGDNSKLQAARNKMLHAFIGLMLIVTSYTLIGYISAILFQGDFNILHPQFITN